MNFYLFIGFNFTILIAGIIAAFRFKRIDKIYLPVILCFWIGAVNETISLLLMLNGHQTLVNNNIYVLTESFLLTLFFKKSGIFSRHWHFLFFIGLFLLTWLLENWLLSPITKNSTYFRIVYSMIIVFFSINLINRLIFSTYGNLIKNATFILCVAFIIYFTYKVLLQSFVIYSVDRKSSFLLNIYIIMIYVNLGTNLLYALAVLWMPRKARYIMLY